MTRRIIACAAGISLAFGGIAFAGPANAADYTKSEERAWKVLKRIKDAKVGRKEIGKYNTIKMMNGVCRMMDGGDSWEDIADDWIGISMTAQNRREQEDFLAYGAAVSYTAVYNLCPWHLVEVEQGIN